LPIRPGACWYRAAGVLGESVALVVRRGERLRWCRSDGRCGIIPTSRRTSTRVALLGVILGQTERIRVFQDVGNLPLRPPDAYAKAAAASTCSAAARAQVPPDRRPSPRMQLADDERERPMAARTLEVGISIIPYADSLASSRELARVADEGGLAFVGIQDHPYQRHFFDTWSLMATLLADTMRISFFTDVANLPLRPPAVMAKAAASLDVLSGGRFELGLGAGGLPDVIANFGGPSRTPGESVEALDEAIDVIRLLWSGAGDQPAGRGRRSGRPSPVRAPGRVSGRRTTRRTGRLVGRDDHRFHGRRL
jgi:Luciferase-like monooxygenase